MEEVEAMVKVKQEQRENALALEIVMTFVDGMIRGDLDVDLNDGDNLHTILKKMMMMMGISQMAMSMG